MAKYFLDFEFIEGFHKPLFGKRRHFIDMISIGIKCEDGREYYAISTDFNPKDANDWVKKNVLARLPDRKASFYDSPKMRYEALLYRSNKLIKKEILDFFGYKHEFGDFGTELCSKDRDIQIYGYYADYDWVLFCSIFGTMMDLPTGMPMYCRDLKQMLDHANGMLKSNAWNGHLPIIMAGDFKKTCKDDHGGKPYVQYQDHIFYPKNEDEHNALSDAKWNWKLYDFLENV